MPADRVRSPSIPDTAGAGLGAARRRALLALGGLAAGGLLGACGGSDASAPAPVSPPNSGNPTPTPGPVPNPQPVPAGSLTSASVTVTGTVQSTIPARFAGLSYEKNSMALPRFTGTNAGLIGMFTRLGPSLLRIGGNSVDETQWHPTGAGQTAGQVAPSDIDALAAFLAATGWTVLYGVNLAASTPELAAEEVAYAVSALGAHLYAIEIGNEPDLYGDKYFSPWTLADFEARWASFRTAILAAAPGVVITGPADAGNITTWTIPFGQSVGSAQIALLTQHYYRGNGQSASSTDALLITPDTALAADLAQLGAGAMTIGVPFRVAETNSFYNGGADGVSDSYASALWVIDHLFHIALAGGVGANLHGGGDGSGYTPIADDDGVVVAARPEFYGLLLVTLAGQGSLLATTVAAGSLNVTAYTVAAADGTLYAVLVNKDSSANLAVTIACPQSVKSASLKLMTGPALDATSGVAIQGAAVGVDGSFTPAPDYTLTVGEGQVQCYLPALSAALVRIET
jgi:hypothetical protein